jgi:hypothetical protein
MISAPKIAATIDDCKPCKNQFLEMDNLAA